MRSMEGESNRRTARLAWRGLTSEREGRSFVSCDASRRLRGTSGAWQAEPLPQPFVPYSGGLSALSPCGEDPRPRRRRRLAAHPAGKYPGRPWWWPGSLLLLCALHRAFSLRGTNLAKILRVSQPQRPQDVGRTGRKL